MSCWISEQDASGSLGYCRLSNEEVVDATYPSSACGLKTSVQDASCSSHLNGSRKCWQVTCGRCTRAGGTGSFQEAGGKLGQGAHHQLAHRQLQDVAASLEMIAL